MKFTKDRPQSDINCLYDKKSAANNSLVQIYSEQSVSKLPNNCSSKHGERNKKSRQETMTSKCCRHESAIVPANNESVFGQGDTCGCSNNNYCQQHLLLSELTTPLRKQYVSPPLLPKAIQMEIGKKLRFYKVTGFSIAEEKKNLGNDQYKAQNYQTALKFYSDAISLCPDSATYYSNRAACYMMLANYTNALNDARTAVRLDPKFEKAYVRIAKCCVAKGDITGAEQAINRIEELDGQSNAVNTEKQAVQQLRQLEQTIQANYGTKAYRVVVYYLDSAIKLAPASYRYRLLKAECLAYLGRCDEAVDIAINVMKSDTSSADAIYVRGLCFYYTDNLEKGIKHFELALQLDPDHKKAKEMRTKSKTLKDMKEKGNVLFKSARYREAQAIYTDALNVDDFNKDINSKLLYNRALVHSKINNLREAVADCTRVLQINDKYLKALLLRARCYNDLEKYDECVYDYEAALQIQKSQEIKKLLRDAKFALKRSKRKDYYRILGVTRSADEDEIKKAYRKKALVHHPDRHANSSPEERKEQELKFKEIGEAYAILSDQRKKSRYDNGQDMEEHEQADFDPNQMFRHFFQFGGAPSSGQAFTFEF